MARVAFLAVAVAAGLAVAAASVGARSAASLDFGDAPDGAPGGYAAKPDVVGRFPAKAASGGPRHTGGGPRLGAGWTGEAASRQVDRDADDGATLTPRSCATSTLVVPLDLSRVRPGLPVYVNAWFDWNQDGDWADGATGRCGPEWGIQNHRVEAGNGIAVLELRFRAGRVPDDFWWRVEVHMGAPAPHAAGGGQGVTRPGETEDRLFSRSRAVAAQRVGYTCAPAAGATLHGSFQQVNSWLTGTAGRSVAIAKADATLFGDKDGVELRRNGGAWTSVIVRSTKQHDRKPVAQTVRVQFDVTAAVEGRLVDFRKTCEVTIWHSARIFPPPVEQGDKRPAVTMPAVGGAVDPIRPDPAKAGCRADVAQAGTNATVAFRCDGLSPKSVTGVGSRGKVTRVRGAPAECQFRERDAHCRIPPGYRGRTARLEFLVDAPWPRFTLYLTAGGVGDLGTTHVLRQDWWFLPDGTVRCSQVIPRAERQRCATIDSRPKLVDE